ncbi:DciA family protein [Aquabacterium humicola]|uniref:DciA family protein n=1 Tax=Aquabacterium humicola TaxID=3237377 RepID=UPI00254343FD|nr:DciA family protein [Rubrivivax pictus]
MPIDRALANCDALARLGQRLALSQACFERIAPLLPPGLRAQVRPGPIDDEGWALLVESGAVSAKLRQLLPALQARLAEDGAPPRPIRVRVMPRR